MRPNIICHMMSSVDGRLDCDRYTEHYSGKCFEEVSKVYFDISNKFNAQAIMIGRKTIQKHYFPQTFIHSTQTSAISFDTYIGKLDSARYTIVTDPKGKIKYNDDQADGENIITILGESVSQEYLDHLQEKGISYLFAGENGDKMELALEILRIEFGIEKIILEGGGVLNGTFLKAGLIDELSLLIYPGIDGLNGMTTIFEYFGKENEEPAKGQHLELTSCEKLKDGIVWLRYKFHNHNQRCCCQCIDY